MTQDGHEKPRIAVSGTTWMGRGIDSIEKEIDVLFSEARREVQIVTYSISMRAPELLGLMEMVLKNGAIIKLIVNNFDNLGIGIRERLLELEKTEGFLLFKYTPKKDNDEDALHAKIIVADRRMALLGSANLSWRGLVSNHEIGVVLYGDAACTVADLVDRLIEKNHQVVQIGTKAA